MDNSILEEFFKGKSREDIESMIDRSFTLLMAMKLLFTFAVFAFLHRCASPFWGELYLVVAYALALKSKIDIAADQLKRKTIEDYEKAEEKPSDRQDIEAK